MAGRCRARNCRIQGEFVMMLGRKSRSLCHEHAQMVLDGQKIELKPYRQPGVDSDPRLFMVDRRKDQTGISGIGVIAEGVQFTDGTVVIRWITETPTTAVFDSIDDLRKVHGHRGDSVIRWVEDA
jgi:hypothetical protein